MGNNAGGTVVRWGVVSTANIGRVAVIPALHRAHNCEVVAVASRSEDRARSFAESNDIPTAYGTYDDLLEDDRVDAVYIPLPNSMHHKWTIRAARAGKHVLCEKPLAVTSEECMEMDAECRAAGVHAMEAFMYRFHPRFAEIERLLQQGVIGELRSLYSAFTFRLTRANNIRWMPEFGGGSLMDVGCYCINVSRTLVGEEPVAVQAIATWTDRGIDSQMAGLLRFARGVTAQFDSALSMERREVVHVAGSAGHLEIANAFLPGAADVAIDEYHGREPVRCHPVSGADEYELMVRHFAECVLRDEPVRYPFSEAAANMRVIESLYQSAREDGRPMTVPPL